jgi:hypothetical protein
MTAISDLDIIHRDVIESAADKRAAIVIMPHHKALLLLVWIVKNNRDPNIFTLPPDSDRGE